MSGHGHSGGDSWGEDDNAVRYDAFVRLYPMYRQTSRDLVLLAGPLRNAAVLDLACGTGATTAEILSVLGPGGTVIGVDKSPATLAVAARRIPDRRVAWIQAAAEDVEPTSAFSRSSAAPPRSRKKSSPEASACSSDQAIYESCATGF